MQWIDLFLHERGSVGSAAGHGATAAATGDYFSFFKPFSLIAIHINHSAPGEPNHHSAAHRENVSGTSYAGRCSITLRRVPDSPLHSMPH